MSNDNTRVLIVDNDHDLCEVVRIALENYGHETRTVNSIYEAQTALNSERFDVAIIDILLDDGYGFGLINDCQQQTPPVPAIVMSGGVSPFSIDPDGPPIDFLSVAKKFGAQIVVRKPFEFDALNRLVCLARDGRARPGADVVSLPTRQ